MRQEQTTTIPHNISGTAIHRIVTVVGARPQFVKAAAVNRAIQKFNASSAQIQIQELILHTGQHYDDNLSKVFFEQLKLPRPNWNLNVGSGSHGCQTGQMLQGVESVLDDMRPSYVLLYGDTNSTLAGALAAAKLCLPVAHVEAGVRSFCRTMPEEINRIVTDQLASLLFCPTKSAIQNLKYEGILDGVHLVGDVMYDSVLFNRSLCDQSSQVLTELGLDDRQFYLATIHRAENTDDAGRLGNIVSSLKQLAYPVVLPLHPRTRKSFSTHLQSLGDSVHVIEPVSYLEMLNLESRARLILTDSGGVQKEAYWFGVPCVTLRDETEWVELLDTGWNRLAGANVSSIVTATHDFERRSQHTQPRADLFGDGNSASKIVSILGNRLNK